MGRRTACSTSTGYPKGKLVDKYCKEWNDQLGERMGHGYQTVKKALKYYLDQMTDPANCD